MHRCRLVPFLCTELNEGYGAIGTTMDEKRPRENKEVGPLAPPLMEVGHHIPPNTRH